MNTISMSFNNFKLVRLIEKDKRREAYERNQIYILKFCRFLIHIVLFLVVLASAIVSKGSLLLITNETNYFEKHSPKVRNKWIWTLIFTVCSPYIISFSLCLLKICFRKTPNPTLLGFLLELVFAALNAIGTSILIFGIFPQLDLARSVLIMNGISILPSTLKLFSEALETSPSSRTLLNNRFYMFVVNLLSTLMQYSVILIVLLTQYVLEARLNWTLPVALVLVSITSSRNFFSFDRSTRPQKSNCMLNIAHKISDILANVEQSRHKIGLVTNPLKIGLFFLFAHIYYSPKFKFNLPHDHLDLFAFLIQLSATLVCYLSASLAFKLRMHRFCFALPLTLITPISIILSVVICENNSVNIGLDDFRKSFICVTSYLRNPFKWQLIVGICLWWVSHIWTTSNIWSHFTLDRFTTIKRPFKFQFFNSVFIENSLMLNSFGYINDLSTRVRKEKEEENKTTKKAKTLLYICATIWHENTNEMLQLLKSIMRLDIDHLEKKTSINGDSFEYEAHIFFDDAIINYPNGSSEPNEYVQNLIQVVSQAACFAHKRSIELEPAIKMVTPYGGRLKFKLPGGNYLVVHLKDKSKIRNKKRWSQVMYMYYLVGYKYFGSLEAMEAYYDVDFPTKSPSINEEFKGFGSLLNKVDPKLRSELENTFILTLDGDVEFRPAAVRLMLDKIRENKRIGSVCGRVHPIGSGPVVWYQVFEYAVGHWLQKVSEHMFGSVLCSPGCFSLLRGSTILEDQILKIYSTKSTKASHYVQYDQGEDRWLSTLIIQQGYYIAYCSTATSMTYSPESFEEYYNQRRRWIPSTMANIIDFLKDYRHILKVNPRIKMMYIFYVFITFIASMLGPSTVVLMLTDTFYFSFDMNLWLSYIFVLIPVLFYVYVCFTFKNETQIKLAAIISSLFSMLMVAVIVGLISRILNSSFLSPNGLILCSLFIIFIISAILHPSEFKCLFPGLLYFLALPSAFILMNLYSLINLNNVSWGTRENKNKSVEQERKSMLFGSLLSKIVSTRDSYSNHSDRKCYKDNLLISLDSLEKRSSEKCYSNKSVDLNSAEDELLLKHDESKSIDSSKKVYLQKNWIDHECLCEFIEENLEDKEEKFFLGLIEKYLYPITLQAQNKEEMQQELTNLRNRCCFNYLILNAFWIILLFTMQLLKNKLEDLIYIRISFGSNETESRYEPVYFTFIMVFLVILFLQFFAMLAHRIITFIQLIRRTRLIEKKESNKKKSRKQNENLNESKEINMAFECEDDVKNQEIEEAEMEIVIESSDKASSTSTKSTSDSPTMTPQRDGHQ